MKKKIIIEKVFNALGVFGSMYAAQKFIKGLGYDYGSNSATEPTAIMKGDYYDYNLPHKMKNFTEDERNSVHGLMDGDFRNGPVTVKIFE
jgi:hypothetical protein